MHLRLNRKSRLPIHLQLKAQLVHLIQRGQWAPGARLPTVRQVAGLLRVNRNTASKVFAELQREGHLSCEPGRGTFVASPRSRGREERTRALLAVVEDVMDRARRLGVSPGEFAAALYARAQAGAGMARLPMGRVLLVGRNRRRLRRWGAELAEGLRLRVAMLRIEDPARMVRRAPGSLRKYALVVTAFGDVREVKALLAGSGVDVAGIQDEASPGTLMRLAALAAGTRVGVVCEEWTGTETVKLSIKHAGLTHVRLVPACSADASSLRRMLKTASVVVCSGPVAGRIRAMARRGTEILVDDRRLDPAGIEMIRRRLAERQVRNGGPRRAASRG